jgi:hypothetical protein
MRHWSGDGKMQVTHIEATNVSNESTRKILYGAPVPNLVGIFRFEVKSNIML